jgi:hypothetical protein
MGAHSPQPHPASDSYPPPAPARLVIATLEFVNIGAGTRYPQSSLRNKHTVSHEEATPYVHTQSGRQFPSGRNSNFELGNLNDALENTFYE